MVSVINVPKGVEISIQATEENNPNWMEQGGSFPLEYKGDMVIRTTNKPPKDTPGNAWDVMQEAPF